MTKSVDIKMARILVSQNSSLPSSHAICTGIDCSGLLCHGCPFYEDDSKVTMADLREQVRVADCLGKPEVSDTDGVRAPSHYQVFDGLESIEVIARSMTVSEFRGFCMGNVLKYRLRAGKKSELATMEKDLSKAAFYQELFDLHKSKCYDA